MPTGVAPNEVEQEVPVDLRIEVCGRWHAVALSELLVAFHSFLVQHANDRWAVHARVPGWRGEPLVQALRAIDEWKAKRASEALVRVDVGRRARSTPRLSSRSSAHH
jgi:hypothetical protein